MSGCSHGSPSRTTRCSPSRTRSTPVSPEVAASAARVAEWTRIHAACSGARRCGPSWFGRPAGGGRRRRRLRGDLARAAATVYELPGACRDPIEIVCRRWERARHPGLVVHESRDVDGGRHRRDRRDRGRAPELAILQLAGVETAAELRRSRHPRGAAQATRHVRLDARRPSLRHASRGLKGVARDCGSRSNAGTRRTPPPRARWRRCCSRRCARTAFPSSCCSSRYSTRTASSSPAPTPRCPDGRSRSSTSRSRSTSTSSRSRPTTGAGTGSSRPATSRSSPGSATCAPADDELAEQIRAVARRTVDDGVSASTTQSTHVHGVARGAYTPVGGQPGRPMVLVSRYSSKPWTPCSRPRPLSL